MNWKWERMALYFAMAFLLGGILFPQRVLAETRSSAAGGIHVEGVVEGENAPSEGDESPSGTPNPAIFPPNTPA